MISSPCETAIGPADRQSKRRIHVHIGAPKTGTTALQYYLYENRDLLRERGYLYPTGLHLTMAKAHHPIYFAVSGTWWHPDFYYDITGDRLPQTAYRREYDIEDCLRELRFAAANSDNLIVSSEGFFDLDEKGVKSLRDALSAYDVSVVLYLRRQDQFIEAMYRNFIVDSGARFQLPLDQYLNNEYVEHCNYLQKVDLWAETFGMDRLNVIPYQSSSLKEGDVIHDFLERIGLKTDGLPAPRRVNASRPNDVLRALSLANSCGWQRREDAADFARFLREAFESDGKVSPLLSRSQAIEFLDQFTAENQELACRYLGRADGQLFDDAYPEPSDEPPAGQNGVKRVKAVGVLKRSVDLLIDTPSADSDEIMLAATALFKAGRNSLRDETERRSAIERQLHDAQMALEHAEQSEKTLHGRLETIQSETERLHREADQARGEAEQTREEAERSRGEAEQARERAEQFRGEAEQAREESEQFRGEAEQAREESEQFRGEAEQAQEEAERSLGKAEQSREEAERSLAEAEQAREETQRARRQAEVASGETEQAKGEAERARGDAEAAQSQVECLQKELASSRDELNQASEQLAASNEVNERLASQMREIFWIMENHVQRGNLARAELQTIRSTLLYRILLVPVQFVISAMLRVLRLRVGKVRDRCAPKTQRSNVGGLRKGLRYVLRHPRKVVVRSVQEPWRGLRYLLRHPKKAAAQAHRAVWQRLRYVLRQPRKTVLRAFGVSR